MIIFAFYKRAFYSKNHCLITFNNILSIIMKKTLLLSALTALAFSAGADDAVWTYVSAPDQIDPDAEYVLGYYNAFTDHELNVANVMSKDLLSVRGNAYANIEGVSLDIEANTLTGVPADAAVLKLAPCGQGYSIYVANAEVPGYLGPSESDGYNGIQTSDTPCVCVLDFKTPEETYDAEIDWGYYQTLISFTSADERNILTYTSGILISWTEMAKGYRCENQAMAGTLGLFKKAGTPSAQVSWSGDPADGSTVETLPFCQLTWEGVTAINVVQDNYTATFDGTDIALVPGAFFENPMVIHFMRRYPQTPGDFVLTLGEGMFKLTLEDGTVIDSPEVVYTVHVTGETTGVELRETTAAPSAIYRPDGTRLQPASAAELPAGLYIIDGKKVIR